jgi:hypothetical protein
MNQTKVSNKPVNVVFLDDLVISQLDVSPKNNLEQEGYDDDAFNRFDD